MNQLIPVLKDVNNQNLIPTIWRGVLSEIVQLFVSDDLKLSEKTSEIISLSEEDAFRIKENIHEYGEMLIELPDATWDTSMYQWMNGYWDVLVDLYTENGASDLALSVRVKEVDNKYIFEVQSIYVP